MSTLKADTIQSTSGGAATLTSQTAAKAFASINNDGTFAQNKTFNVSSSTDTDTGKVTNSFTSSMSDADYCCTSNNNTGQWAFRDRDSTRSASTSQFEQAAYEGAFLDANQLDAVIFGDLA